MFCLLRTQPLAWWRKQWPVVVLAGGVLVGGCAGQQGYSSGTQAASESAVPGSAAGGEQYAAAPGSQPASDAAPTNVPRRIIYTADIELTVDRLSSAEPTLYGLVEKHGGYRASSNLSGRPGETRTGTWKVRIPVRRYESFMTDVARMGEVRRFSTDSQDVSAEYYDAEARLRNKRVEEQRLLQHLRASTAKLSDILAVERELSRVREEIEQIEGRLRVLKNQTDLTTITVTLHELQGYVPPRKAGFGTQISRTFGESWGLLLDFGRGLVLLVVAAIPWILAGAVLLVPLLLMVRSGTRRIRTSSSEPGQ